MTKRICSSVRHRGNVSCHGTSVMAPQTAKMGRMNKIAAVCTIFIFLYIATIKILEIQPP